MATPTQNELNDGLGHAIDLEDFDLIRNLINEGADPNAPDKSGKDTHDQLEQLQKKYQKEINEFADMWDGDFNEFREAQEAVKQIVQIQKLIQQKPTKSAAPRTNPSAGGGYRSQFNSPRRAKRRVKRQRKQRKSRKRSKRRASRHRSKRRASRHRSKRRASRQRASPQRKQRKSRKRSKRRASRKQQKRSKRRVKRQKVVKRRAKRQRASRQRASRQTPVETFGSVVFTGGPLLAKEYIDKDGNRAVDPKGWWASEKFDGYRAIWNGKSFVSRNGKPYVVPEWFRELMPVGIALDGEFWMGRGNFQNCGIFRKKVPNAQEWRDAGVQYTVYDIPSESGKFEERMDQLRRIVKQQCKEIKNCPLVFTEQTKVKSADHLDKMFKDVVKRGGEGIMIRQPESYYEKKRSKTLLKYKQFGDTECKIVGYKPGTGKYTGMLGSFECELLKGVAKRFNVSGMDDCIRTTYRKTHPVGTIITITFNEKTNDGIPRFPRYLRKRDDHDL